MPSSPPDSVIEAARILGRAKALLITAGAGMGVDSGLPDFRGNEGFWNAYPPFRERGLSFSDLANPQWFSRDPELAWGFYGHRLNLYRATVPHRGFGVLRAWADALPHGAFVFTSNVDGQFQKAGFSDERIVECHGSIHHVQCTEPCADLIESAASLQVTVDARFRAAQPLPRCSRCEALLRPNILMFGDVSWVDTRTLAEQQRFGKWLAALPPKPGALAIVELGAGTAVPTVRLTSEHLMRRANASLVRINVREPEAPHGAVALALGAEDALLRIDAALSRGDQ